MAATPTTETVVKELDYRAGDGIEVRLLWDSLANRVWVAVSDQRTDESFEVTVQKESPLEVFYHPFAYAAFRRVDYRAEATCSSSSRLDVCSAQTSSPSPR